MKQLILITALLSVFYSKAQNLVGTTRDNIEFIAKTENWKMTKSTTKTGTPFIEVDDEDAFKFYYFRNDTCIMYLVFYNKIGGDDIVSVLDKTYPKQDTTWYSNNTVINLAYDEVLNGYFVKYRLAR